MTGWRFGWIGGLTIVMLLGFVGACDNKRIAELEEGVATEADVRARFGEPEAVYVELGGARTLEYPRQPEGQRNYMITIGTDGRMSALRQVLRPDVFAKIETGMDRAQVRRLIGRPAKTQVFALKNEEVWDWRFIDGPESKLFSVTFDSSGRVMSTATGPDARDGQSGLR